MLFMRYALKARKVFVCIVVNDAGSFYFFSPDNGEVLTTGCYHYGQLGTMPSEGPSHTTPLDRESDNQDALLPCSSCFCGKQETSKEARFMYVL